MNLNELCEAISNCEWRPCDKHVEINITESVNVSIFMRVFIGRENLNFF